MMNRFTTALVALVGLAGAASAQTLINGAGATFPEPMYSKWFSDFKKLHNNIQINYTANGSGAGITAVTAGTVDFAGSDAILTDAQLKAFKDKQGFGVLCFPTVMGAVVLTYNVAGVSGDLKLTPDAVAGIYLGKITKWNDPALGKANPGVTLPGKDIVVVHRSDSSGTSFIFTDYLAKVSADWRAKVSPTGAAAVQWPTGLGGSKNEGVAGLVKQQANSIGYVELSFAIQNKMNYATIQNSAGAFVKPSLESVTAAAAASAKTIPDDFRVSITNPPGKDSYPISSFTWLLIPEQIKDASKKTALTDFLTWMLKDGQALAAPLTYAPLPKAVVDKEVKAIAKIK
jgi:phosphate transport system substrate-binding protein